MSEVASPSAALLRDHLQKAWEHIRRNDQETAMEHARKASTVAPDSPEVAHVLGLLASRDERPDLALPLLQKALDSGVTECRLRDMAEALLMAGHAQAALAPVQDAIRQFGESAEMLGLLAAILVALEEFDSATAAAQKAIALKPHLMMWDSTLGFCQLIRRQMLPGFQALTGRAENLPAGSRAPALQFAAPCDIWLKNEQGPGDTLFHLRYAPVLVKHGFRLHIQTDRKIRALLRDADLFASVKDEFRCPADGFWLNMGDLPLAGMQLGGNEVEPPLPLRPELARVEKIRKKLAAIGPAPYIAVTWRGGPRGKKQRGGLRMFSKQVPALELGKSLAPVKGTVISLQRLPEPEENKDFRQGLGRDFADFSTYNDNLQDMLALLAIVDDYVAVPNTNVHLRESLGKKSEILLNRPWQDWRWLAETSASPWYPNSTIYRQGKEGKWQQVLEAIASQLQSRYGVAEEAAAPLNANVLLEERLAQTLKNGWNALDDGSIPPAIQAAQNVLKEMPEHAGALHLLGWVAFRDLKIDLALSVLQRASQLAPSHGKILGDLIRVMAAGKQPGAALEVACQALENPDLKDKAAIYYARAAVYTQLNRLPEAIADYEACLKVSPNSLDALAYSGMARMKMGDARRGFREYSARPESRLESRREGMICPWLHGDVRGLKVLIKRDMGLGDELTYLRYLPWLMDAGVEVTYWAGTKLAPILERMGYASRILSDDTPVPQTGEYDISFWVNELPVAVEAMNAPEIAPPLPLAPRPDLVEKWTAWLSSLGPAPYIGINWRAGAAAQGAATAFSKLAKAIDKDCFARTLAPVQATWVSLQRNVMLEEMQEFRHAIGAPVHDAAALTDDLEDLLALLSLLDENIGVSNTNMHLRAGLGLPSRVLVQNPGGDWRWGHDGSSSLWFTDCRVYRQSPDSDWAEALEALQQDLLWEYGQRARNDITLMTSGNTGGQTRRIIWVTAGTIKTIDGGQTSDLASARYRVLAPAQALKGQGWQSEFINEEISKIMGGWGASVPQAGDTVVISKVFTSHALRLARDAKSRGATLIVDFCDDFFSHAKRGPLQKSLLTQAEKIIVSTKIMAEAVRKQGPEITAIISDPVEMPRGKIRFCPGPKLKLLWFGHAVNLDTLVQFLPQLAQYAKVQPLCLNVVTTLPDGTPSLESTAPAGLDIHYTPWSIEAMRQALDDCDIVVIPTIFNHQKTFKSANRLLEPLQAGRFVITGSLPAYLPFADSAWVNDDLLGGITWALRHPEEVINRIRQGQKDIEQFFSTTAIGKAWEEAIMMRHNTQTATQYEPRPSEIKRLNLGCGDKILPGYVNVDVVENRAGKKPDVLCDLHKLEPFEDNSVDEILAVHVVEHFWRWEVLDILKEWTRVLKPGGKMILECPNLLSACEEFLKNPEAAASGGPEGQRSMWVFYGDPRWQDPYMVHRWGYTPQSLANLMGEAGLVNARQEPAQYKLREPRDMRIVAEKPATESTRHTNQVSANALPEGKITMNQPVSAMNNMSLPGNKSIEEHLWDGYLTWFYHTNVWKQMTWHGIRTLKLPSDMWNYQEIIHERKMDWVIEAGTRHGGSALFFAETLAARKAKGKVISMDIDATARQIESHEHIEFLIGDSGSQKMVERVAATLPDERGPIFLILDSDHSCTHVLRELEVWVPFLRTGDYLIVEDSAINGHPVRPDFGPGPYEAIEQFIAKHPGLLNHDAKRERKFGPTQAPKGYWIRN